MNVLPLLPNALLHGVFLKKSEIEACLLAEEIDIPSGRVLKAELVELLLQAVLPETVSEAGLSEIVPMGCPGSCRQVFGAQTPPWQALLRVPQVSKYDS